MKFFMVSFTETFATEEQISSTGGTTSMIKMTPTSTFGIMTPTTSMTQRPNVPMAQGLHNLVF